MEALTAAARAPPHDWVEVSAVLPVVPPSAVGGGGGGGSVGCDGGGGGGGAGDVFPSDGLVTSLRRDWMLGDVAMLDRRRLKALVGHAVATTSAAATSSGSAVNATAAAAAASGGGGGGGDGGVDAGDDVMGESGYEEDDEEAVQIMGSTTLAVVHWANGSISAEPVKATGLVPKAMLGDHDFLPFDFVARSDQMQLGGASSVEEVRAFLCAHETRASEANDLSSLFSLLWLI